jgi:hypothetical protein
MPAISSRSHAGPMLFLVILLLAGSAHATELITNGGFETFNGSSPANWSAATTNASLSLSMENTVLVAGSRALRVSGRSSERDGPLQVIKNNLNAAINGGNYGFRLSIRTRDVASVRVLLRYTDAQGQGIDQLLAEKVITTPDAWTRVEGSHRLSWQGTLQGAYIFFEVFQLSREAGTLSATLVPDYYLDEISMDLDSDGDYLFDRDEAALGFNPQRADTDGDSLPDRWERDHGFSPAVDESAGDPDHDGFTNREEFFAATDPLDANQYPGKPANPGASAGTRALLQWLALLPSKAPAGHLVVGQMVNDLAATEYQDYIENLASTTGA